MSRHNGRILAFQALFSYEAGAMPLEDILQFAWTEGEGRAGRFSDEERDFARLLVNGTCGNIEQVDERIKKHLSASWDFSRLNKVSLAILRLSVYSLMFQKEMKPSIIIDEAIDLAKVFGSDDSFKFVNAILDKINKVEIT